MPLRAAPTAAAEASLRGAIHGPESFALHGTTLYLAYPEGIGRSKLTSSIVERRLGTIGTACNWNTALKITVALAG